jgi:hypothetical protein
LKISTANGSRKGTKAQSFHSSFEPLRELMLSSLYLPAGGIREI